MDLLYGWLLGVCGGNLTNPTRITSDSVGDAFELILVELIKRARKEVGEVNTNKIVNVCVEI